MLRRREQEALVCIVGGCTAGFAVGSAGRSRFGGLHLRLRSIENLGQGRVGPLLVWVGRGVKGSCGIEYARGRVDTDAFRAGLPRGLSRSHW